LDGVLVPHSTVSSASEFYRRAVEKINPNLPINLLGHSFGGWVAFDMAQRLLESGGNVASLVILDSDAPDTQYTPPREYSQTEVMTRMIDLFEQIIGHSLDLNRNHLDSMRQAAQIAMLNDRLIKEELMPYHSESNVLQAILRTFSAALRTHYEPNRTYSGPLHLLLADNNSMDQDANQRRHELIGAGWRRWAPNLVCTRVPGNHLTMLKPPHVFDLAQLLSAIVRGPHLSQ
jgi:thioesterase domain-containing protein